MDVGKKLKVLRLGNNLTQEELASRLELTKGYISLLENNKTSPSMSTLFNILEVLGTDVHEFFSKESDQVVTFKEEDFSVKATVRKAVTWDTNTLWEALNKVEEDFGSEVAKNISDITVKVSENKYKDADPRIQLILEESRTVEAKGPDYYISVEEKLCD